nr:DUF4010 domain-containing protein [Desulfuromonas sp. TF]
MRHLRLPAAYFQPYSGQSRKRKRNGSPETKNPTELAGAVAFGLFHGVVLTAVSAGMYCFGCEGGDMVNLISGLTDAAIALAGLTALLI